MSLSFFGWKACREKRRRLKPGQAPRGGRSYTMYHGTHKNNAKAIITTGFHQSQGGTLGPGVYCSRDIKKASSYPALCGPADRVVLELRVRVGKVKRIDGQGLQLQTSWHQHGYDTAWMPASGGRFEEDCVWDPKRLSVVGVVHCSDPAPQHNLLVLWHVNRVSPDFLQVSSGHAPTFALPSSLHSAPGWGTWSLIPYFGRLSSLTSPHTLPSPIYCPKRAAGYWPCRHRREIASQTHLSPPRRRQQAGSDSDLSPPRRKARRSPDSDQSPRRRPKAGSDSDLSPTRRRPQAGSDSDLSPPRKARRPSSPSAQGAVRMLSGAAAGLVSVELLRKEREESRRHERDSQHLEEASRNADTIFRDKSGKRRDIDQEREEQRRKAGEKAEKDEKYAQWGKGLVQGEMQQRNVEAALREAQKPLARHIDDVDLDQMLREQEREGDPMAGLLRRKKEKDSQRQGVPEKPRYKGPAPPPNRFNIAPGYRWDGVDRSNGFERQRYSRLADKKAVQEMAYKWSVEDM
ncbi:BUD13 protein, partial [Amia calva]|nr:BUD13 protein [Amia calva]